MIILEVMKRYLNVSFQICYWLRQLIFFFFSPALIFYVGSAVCISDNAAIWGLHISVGQCIKCVGKAQTKSMGR